MKPLTLLTTFLFFLSLTAVNAQSADDFVTTWKTDNPGVSDPTAITIPTLGAGYNYDVDWNNDGTFDQFGITGDVTHNFDTPGTYTIRITGAFPRIHFGFNNVDQAKILSVDQWGSIAWSSMEEAFLDCINLTIAATDAPDLTGVTNLNYMFAGCSQLTGDFSQWDVSEVTDMFATFADCTSFNADISGWNVSKVTMMSSMFNDCTLFNTDISGWDVSSVTDMSGMFSGCTLFNVDISGWDVSNVTSFGSILGMFFGATSFNQPIGNWDVSKAKSMSGMFFGATSFNQPLSNWDTMVAMVTAMDNMFRNATSFNQPIGGWNVSSVNFFYGMFAGAADFDQDLSTWDVSSATQMSGMFDGITLSTANYDALLSGWSQLPLQNNVVFSGGNSQYCAAAAERQQIIDNFNWAITDGGEDQNCVQIQTWYADTDTDGYGDPENSVEASDQPPGFVDNNLDCDDNDPNEFPDQVWYEDVDGDGISGGEMLMQCERPAGYAVASELTALSGDNCPLVFNPFQTDTDGAGIGDACDCEDTNSSNEYLIVIDLSSKPDPTLPAGTYQANQDMEVTATVAANSTVILTAGHKITLKPGFQAAAGADFHAYIDRCEDPEVSTASAATLPQTTAAIQASNISGDPALKLYPNPVSTTARLQFFLAEEGAVRVRLYDRQGRLLSTLVPQSHFAAGTHALEWSVEALAPGLYLLYWEHQGRIQTLKFMKVR